LARVKGVARVVCWVVVTRAAVAMVADTVGVVDTVMEKEVMTETREEDSAAQKAAMTVKVVAKA